MELSEIEISSYVTDATGEVGCVLDVDIEGLAGVEILWEDGERSWVSAESLTEAV